MGYTVPNKQKPIIINTRKCYNFILREVINIGETWENNSEKLKFELEKYLGLNPDELKMFNYVTTERSNSILDQQSHRNDQGICLGAEVSDHNRVGLNCFETTPRMQSK